MQIWGTVKGPERKPGVYIALGLGEVWVGHWVPLNLAVSESALLVSWSQEATPWSYKCSGIRGQEVTWAL